MSRQLEQSTPVLRTSALMLQRKCSCGQHTVAGGECAECSRKRHVQRSSRGTDSTGPLPMLGRLPGSARPPEWSTGAALQRAPAEGAETAGQESVAPAPATQPAPPSPAPEATPATTPEAAPTEEPAAEATEPAGAAGRALLVEDDATDLEPGQMRKSEFLDRLRSSVCTSAESAMAGTGNTTAGCPYLDFWFGYYGQRSSGHVERALRRYAPETANVTTAAGYIPLVAARVRQSVAAWAETGQVTGLPEGIPLQLPGTGLLGAIGGLATGIGGLLLKPREGADGGTADPGAVASRLGDGSPLESGVRTRMESAFGRSFAHVRTHTGSRAAGLSKDLNARAFTVGGDMAFAPGEYRPGSLAGDALIAHELAHVVQQGGGETGASVSAMRPGASGYDALEKDADDAAVGAVSSLWGGAGGLLAGAARNAVPSLRSGLRLSRCSRGTTNTGTNACTTRTGAVTPRKTVTVRHSHLFGGGSSSDFTRHLNYADNVYDIAGIDVVAGNEETINETDTKDAGLLGTNATLDVSADPPRSGSYTAEETALLSHNSASGQITAYYIKELDNVDLWGLAYVESDALMLEPPVSDRVLAHEIGHILMGLGHPSNNDNIMARSSDATGVDCLSDPQITAARDHSLSQ